MKFFYVFVAPEKNIYYLLKHVFIDWETNGCHDKVWIKSGLHLHFDPSYPSQIEVFFVWDLKYWVLIGGHKKGSHPRSWLLSISTKRSHCAGLQKHVNLPNTRINWFSILPSFAGSLQCKITIIYCILKHKD